MQESLKYKTVQRQYYDCLFMTHRFTAFILLLCGKNIINRSAKNAQK